MSRETPRLVLASGSPRRRELLGQLGLSFDVRPADVDETPEPDENPHGYVLRLAEAKARAAAGGGDELILAADTIVVEGDDILGKPKDREDAAAMLRRLSGIEHEVLTAIGIYQPSRSVVISQIETTRVRFVPLEDRDIDWYVSTEEPLDKAGAYGIQGLGGLFVESVRGNYSNVVGLPLSTTARLIRRFGYHLLDFNS